MNVNTVLLILLLFVSGSAYSDIEVGEIPFASLGKNSANEEINLKNYQGKVVIVTFWATWCGPCMKEIPVLSAIQKNVSAQNLQVIAISYKETKKTFKQVAKALSDNPILFSYDKNGRIAKKHGVKAIPYMLIIGRDGTVKAKHVGYSEENVSSLIDEINSLLLKNS